MSKDNIVTVDYLLSLFRTLSEQGKGNMKIKCMDNFLHDDEISINYMENEILFSGNIFNCSLADKVKQFCNDIEKAKERFYMEKD